jgi:CxxC motif-containing protein (DUF1111 family)
VYGGQLQPLAIPGVAPEGAFRIEYREVPGTYADGEPYALLEPAYHIEDLGYGPLAPDVRVSPRVAPIMVGLGLLEAIPADRLEALADPEDADGDGISGRPNRVWNAATGATDLGRFGWKAEQPTVRTQSAGAFLGDLGVTSALNPAEDCTPAQAECAAAVSGGAPEIADDLLDRVAVYASLLAVPVRRGWDTEPVLRGKRLFRDAGCHACHVPRHETRAVAALPEVAGQAIWPYTDLLLHDMGEGLSDDRPAYLAEGREWRTPPLWGIGLVPIVNNHERFLHDGRARGLAEAILWHGGEAEASREAFRGMPAADREALLRFVESL